MPTDASVTSPITLDEILQARERISSIVCNTPMRISHELSRKLDHPFWLKMETMQDTGAFKLRGAANKILSLLEQKRPQGLITVSSGNHGRAVAYVANLLGIQATVCITSIVPEYKIEALRMFGAEVVIHGNNQNEADKIAQNMAEERDLDFIPAFDDRFVIAGQGTLGLEMIEAHPELETLLVQLSGGGLASGVALAVKAINPDIRVIGVSSEFGAAMLESIKAGKIVSVEERPSIADALPGPIPKDNLFTFPMCKALLDDIVQVSDSEIKSAMAFIMKHERLIVEGGGAVGVAAVLHERLLNGSTINVGGPSAAILTGDNIATDKAMKIYEENQISK